MLPVKKGRLHGRDLPPDPDADRLQASRALQKLLRAEDTCTCDRERELLGIMVDRCALDLVHSQERGRIFYSNGARIRVIDAQK